jgi:3-hydroxyacyl-[acyl-carrier-protein] dehydratase
MDPQAPLFHLLNLQNGPVVTCILEIQAGHPILMGHFPGQPVVPGACILRAIHEAVEMAAGQRLVMAEASQIKFLHPLLPDKHPKTRLQFTFELIENLYLKVNATLGWEELVFTKFRGSFRPL